MNERLVIPDRAGAERELAVARPWREFPVSFNVAVSHIIPVARIHERESEGVMMRWGLVPQPGKLDLTHDSYARVRSDALVSSENFRGAWFHGQRGIVPVAGFYVWQRTPSGFRQPYYVRLVNRLVFGVAVLWERSASDDDDVAESCALVTVPANSLLTEIDNTGDQMLAILRHKDYDTWLGSSIADAKGLLDTYPRACMVSHPVGPYVNKLEFDDPRLIQRIPEDTNRDVPRGGAAELPPAADAIVEEITVKAGAERIFVALTDPQQVSRWWSAAGRFEVSQVEMDLRPGGRWHMLWSGVGGWPSSVRGVFREINRPRALAFTWLPSWVDDPLESSAAQSSVVRFELQEQGGGVTRVRLTHSEFTSARARARHHGWPEILSWLRVYAEEHA